MGPDNTTYKRDEKKQFSEAPEKKTKTQIHRFKGKNKCRRKGQIYRMRRGKTRTVSSVWSIRFDSFNAALSRKNTFSSLRFTYCQYSVSNLNGFNPLLLYI